MRRFKDVKGAGPWKFNSQSNKFAYINNPRWTMQMAHQDAHKPCGYWYKGFSGWSPEMPYVLPYALPIWEPSAMSIDEERRKIYTTCVYNYVGTKSFRMVFETDIDTFKHTRAWGCEGWTQGPAINDTYFRDYYLTNHVWYRVDRGDKYLIPISHGRNIDLLNARTNTIRTYSLTEGGTPGWFEHHYTTIFGLGSPGSILNTQVDESEQRLYVYLVWIYFYLCNETIGYIDLNTNTWNEVRYDCHRSRTEYFCHPNTVGDIRLSEAQFGADGGNRLRARGNILPRKHMIYTVGTLGNKRYNINNMFDQLTIITNPNLGPAALLGDDIYAINTLGLHRIHKRGYQVSTLTPPYASGPYKFNDICTGSNDKIYITHEGYGIAEYTPQTNSWRLLNDWQLFGPHPFIKQLYEGNFSLGIVYDDKSKCVYSGFGDSFGLWDLGPWNNSSHPEHMNINWRPETETSLWGCYIARHSIQPTPPVEDIPEIILHPEEILSIDVPMIWTMPNNK